MTGVEESLIFSQKYSFQCGFPQELPVPFCSNLHNDQHDSTHQVRCRARLRQPHPEDALPFDQLWPDRQRWLPDAQRTMVFEDAPTGVEAARRAGMHCVMVPDERLAKNLQSGAHLVLPSLAAVCLDQFVGSGSRGVVDVGVLVPGEEVQRAVPEGFFDADQVAARRAAGLDGGGGGRSGGGEEEEADDDEEDK